MQKTQRQLRADASGGNNPGVTTCPRAPSPAQLRGRLPPCDTRAVHVFPRCATADNSDHYTQLGLHTPKHPVGEASGPGWPQEHIPRGEHPPGPRVAGWHVMGSARRVCSRGGLTQALHTHCLFIRGREPLGRG